MNKQVTILIPTMFDSRYIIELCLESIRKYSTYPYGIIVGNNGVDAETLIFLKRQNDIHLVDVPKDKAAKDALAEMVETEYYLFLHDDTQILRKGWLERRINIMEQNNNNAIVGPIDYNYCYDFRKKFLFHFNKSFRRFFPLGMLVKTKFARELNLQWGIIKDKFDTGGYAYQQFCSQKKYKFVRYHFKYDICHFSQMSWPVKKKMNQEVTSLNLDNLIETRKQKIELIKNILAEKKY